MKFILLVDDDPQLLKLLQRQLKSQADPWEVVTARDGLEAIRLVREREFDLIITDLVMPDQDGLGIIREVRKAKPAMRLLAMTGGGRRVGGDYLQIAKALGANAVLQKPIALEVLIETVRGLLPAESPRAPLPGIADASDSEAKRQMPKTENSDNRDPI